MRVTKEDLQSGRIALLSPDWRQHQTADGALALQRRRWHHQLCNHRSMRTMPSGSGLVVGADSDRGVIIELVPQGWRYRILVMAIVPGSATAEMLTREVQTDFDVVEVATNTVLASARGTGKSCL